MANISLYGLKGEYLELYDMLTDADSDQKETIENTLEAVKGEIEVKAAGYLAVMNQLQMEENECKRQMDEWESRYKAKKNGRERLKKCLLEGMIEMGIDELDADGVKIKVSNAGGVLPIIYDDSVEVPDRFLKVIYEKDAQKIREALDNGEQLDFCRFGNRRKILKIK